MNAILKEATQNLETGAASFAFVSAQSENPEKNKLRYRDMIDIIEEAYFRQLMIECDDNQTLAARKADLNRATLRNRLVRHNLL